MLTRTSFFPPVPKSNAASINLAILMYGSVIIFALIWFRVRARHVYVGPVEYIRKNV
jgi:choline transport protein